MSLIIEYRATEEAIKELQERLEKLSGSEALMKELEFEERLRALMAEYGKNLRDIIKIIDPEASKKVVAQPATKMRAPRALKTYRNPHTGETIETKGGNHRQLKEWKQQYGAEAVASWVAQ